MVLSALFKFWNNIILQTTEYGIILVKQYANFCFISLLELAEALNKFKIQFETEFGVENILETSIALLVLFIFLVFVFKIGPQIYYDWVVRRKFYKNQSLYENFKHGENNHIKEEFQDESKNKLKMNKTLTVNNKNQEKISEMEKPKLNELLNLEIQKRAKHNINYQPLKSEQTVVPNNGNLQIETEISDLVTDFQTLKHNLERNVQRMETKNYNTYNNKNKNNHNKNSTNNNNNNNDNDNNNNNSDNNNSDNSNNNDNNSDNNSDNNNDNNNENNHDNNSNNKSDNTNTNNEHTLKQCLNECLDKVFNESSLDKGVGLGLTENTGLTKSNSLPNVFNVSNKKPKTYHANKNENTCLLVEIAKYWNSRPCNASHSKLPRETLAFFQEVKNRKYKLENHLPDFVSFSSWNKKHVLELGCGIGTNGVAFIQAGAHYCGIDISETSIELAKKNLELSANIKNSENFYCANMENLDQLFTFNQNDSKEEKEQTTETKETKEMKETKQTKETLKHDPLKIIATEPFDLVFSWASIAFTANPNTVFEQLHTVLKVGGMLKIMLPSTLSWYTIQMMNQSNMWNIGEAHSLVAAFNKAHTGSPITHSFTVGQINRLLGSSFKIINIEKAYIFMYDTDIYKKTENLVLAKYWQALSEDVRNDLQKEMGSHILITAIRC
jgi:SAM-dependent methyltransferase